MGMYTKLNLNIPIKKDISVSNQLLIENLIDGNYNNSYYATCNDYPDHPFFNKDNRKSGMFKSSSYYFTGTNNSEIKYDDLREHSMVVHIDCDFKNYSNEIEDFLDWIKQYIDYDEFTFLGYSRYEEDEYPKLYYYNEGKIIVEDVNEIKNK